MSAGATEGRFVIDLDQRITGWDATAEALLAVPAWRAIGERCYQLVAGADASGRPVCRPGCAVIEAIRQGRIAGAAPLVVHGRGGRQQRLICALTALPNPPGGALGRLSSGDAGASRASADLLVGIATLATRLAVAPLERGLEQALDFVMHATAADAAELFLAEPGSRGMVLTCHRGAFRHAFAEIPRFAPGEGFPGLVLAQAQPLATSCLPEEPRYLRMRVKQRGFSSYVCVPLIGSNAVLGAMGVAFRRRLPDLQPVVLFLSWVSAPVSLLVDATLSRCRVMTAAQLQARAATREQQLDEVLDAFLAELVRLGQAESGEIHLIQCGLDVHRSTGRPLRTLPCPLLAPERAAACPALWLGQGIILQGARSSWPPACRSAVRPGTSWLCVPIAADGQTLGIARLGYARREPIPSGRLVLLETTAAAAGEVIRSALLSRARIQQASTVLWSWLERERARSGARPDAPTSPAGSTPDGLPHQSEAPYLEVRCFGNFELAVRGRTVTPLMVRRRRVLTLLKILLAHGGRPESRDVLTEMLWPEADPETKASQFYVLVHELRRLIEPPDRPSGWTFICNTGDRYYFNPAAPARIDVEEFRALVQLGRRAEAAGNAEAAIAAYEQAVGLYRGDYLQEELYSDWCWQEREQLRETCLAVLRSLAALWGKAGVWDRSVEYLRRALELDQLREEIHRELMYALWAAGRRDEAVRQYDVCARLLRAELDLEPLPETQQLLQRIRAGPEPALLA